MILDIHTHHPAPCEGAVADTPATPFNPLPGQLYSVGIHPWTTAAGTPDEEEWRQLETAAARPEVVAIGECGIDTLKGGPMFRQLLVMKRQIELSERLGKPLIVHDVKAHDIITGLRRDMAPRQTWVVHGFRGKPTVAKMLLDAGCMLSFGERFNADTVRAVPADRILAETDESPMPIAEIIARLSEARGEDITATVAANTRNLLGLKEG